MKQVGRTMQSRRTMMRIVRRMRGEGSGSVDQHMYVHKDGWLCDDCPIDNTMHGIQQA